MNAKNTLRQGFIGNRVKDGDVYEVLQLEVDG